MYGPFVVLDVISGSLWAGKSYSELVLGRFALIGGGARSRFWVRFSPVILLLSASCGRIVLQLEPLVVRDVSLLLPLSPRRRTCVGRVVKGGAGSEMENAVGGQLLVDWAAGLGLPRV
ncbi:unnamed protein product, partial [Linum tenue]